MIEKPRLPRMPTPNNHFIPPLLEWFAAQAADLPWRQNPTPYRVWLSEVMLQQTQITTVIPYFLRFTEQFPTVFDLAAADQDRVLKLWEGLGYYSRARNMHKAAQIVASQYHGKFPNSAADLQTLPGIGRYTAGAIASIAFGEPVPVLDGNVMRVFARLFDLADDITLAETKDRLWKIGETLVPTDHPGDYNQALMELGQKVCKPRNPFCKACPVRDYCAAYQAGVQEERPVKSPKSAIPHYDVTAGLVRNSQGQLLIAKRPDDKLLGGLWEFPGGKQENGETLAACLERELIEELGIQVQVGDFFVKVRHAFTHFKITLHVFECDLLPDGGEPQALGCADWRWVSENELEHYAFGAADRQVITALKVRPQMLF
jgi:A/G-specific adenine glycosylase